MTINSESELFDNTPRGPLVLTSDKKDARISQPSWRLSNNLDAVDENPSEASKELSIDVIQKKRVGIKDSQRASVSGFQKSNDG